MYPHTLTLTLAIGAVELVDFGVSTSFEATDLPPRGQQGTITYTAPEMRFVCVQVYWVSGCTQCSKRCVHCEVPPQVITPRGWGDAGWGAKETIMVAMFNWVCERTVARGTSQVKRIVLCD